jgi:hypothetical protein
MKYNGKYDNDNLVANHLGNLFINRVNPILKDNYKMIQTENMSNDLAQLLDKLSGIDAVMFNNNGVSGVGLRMQQYKDKHGNYIAFHTFTIRYSRSTGTETEYTKRKRQIYGLEPTFYPHYTMQAYFDGNKDLISGAFCKTKSIFDAAIKFEPFEKRGAVYLQTNKFDGNQFIVVPYTEINPIVVFGKSGDHQSVKIKNIGQQLTILY